MHTKIEMIEDRSEMNEKKTKPDRKPKTLMCNVADL